MADKEHQLTLTQQQYQALQQQLEHMLLTIAKETDDIKRLEGELREGEVLAYGTLTMLVWDTSSGNNPGLYSSAVTSL